MKNPIFFVPCSGFAFYILHKVIMGKFKPNFLQEAWVDMQILWYGINVTYLLRNSSSYSHFYLLVITVSQIFLIIFGSLILRALYEYEKMWKFFKTVLSIILVIIPFFGFYVLVHTMGFRFISG